MLLAVLTCQSATETAQRHWPNWNKYFKKQEVVFVTTVDSNCWVPDGVQQWKIGRDYYPDRDKPDANLPQRTMDVLAVFLKTGDERLVLIEYDVVLFARPKLKAEFSGTMFSEFIHSPWCFTRECARKFLHTGSVLLDHGVISGGWPDRHLRLIHDLLLPERDINANYSQNTLDQPWMLQSARHAVAGGAFGIHGVKTKEQFDAITR